MWLVEVPLQVGKCHLGLITNAASDSSVIYYALTMRSIWLWGSQLDLLPLVCQRTTCRRPCSYIRHVHNGWDPSVPTVLVVYEGLYVLVRISGETEVLRRD